jgi:hypothetical protein
VAYGASLSWEADNTFRLTWAEWRAGEAPAYRPGETYRVGYRAMTLPAPVRKVGNHWTGGGSTAFVDCLGCGHNVTMTEEQFRAFKSALAGVAAG